MNQLKFSVLALALLCSPIFAKDQKVEEDPFTFIRNTDLSQFPVKLRAKYHKEITELMVKLESAEKFPKFKPSRFSFSPIMELLSGAILDECVAGDDQSNACLFGGWVSRRNGSCSRPWGSSSKALAQSMDVPSYDSNYYCGSDNLFRCNPLMFGPGIDQELAGSEFPNVNGKKNNKDPYASGICVNVKSGYNGLSERCQAASEKLDEIRKSKGMPAWRESSFFDEEKAKDFSKLQAFVADKCAQNSDALNKDNMCTSLNRSLGMTAAAVVAGGIEGITPEQLFPGCDNYKTTALPKCNDEVSSEFDPMVEAMEELRQSRKCSFAGIQAIDGESLNNSFEAPEPNCRSSVVGLFKSSGFGSNSSIPFSFYFVGADNQQLGRIEAPITKGMSKEAIMAALSTGANQEAFNRYCDNSVCPRSENPTLKNLYGALDKLKERENCNLGSVHAVDYASESSGIFEHSSCGLSIEGGLGSDGLPQEESKRTKISITLRDKKGVFLTQTHIEISSEMSADQIMKLIPEEEVAKACVHSNTTDKTDGDAAIADLGISDKTYVPTYWKDKLDDIRNLAESQEPALKNFRAEVDEYGNLKLYADDVNGILAMQTQLGSILNGTRTDGGRFNFVGSPELGHVVIEGAPASVAVESIAQRNGLKLDEHRRKLLEEIGTEQPLRDISVDEVGNITITTLDKNGDGPLFQSGETYQGFSVVPVSESDQKLYNGLVTARKHVYKLTQLGRNGKPLQVACVQEGGSAAVSPDSPDCCQGLTWQGPTDGSLGSKGVCVKISAR